tara:strand:- start:8615 stop:9034 length:420 start_codon:yes stop_codon:yes gene_type:complete
MSRDHVPRAKYETLKGKAERWRDKAVDYEKRYEDILAENEQLTLENEELQDNMLSRVDLGKHKELEDDICELKKELDESTCREAALQEENSILLVDVQTYKRQYKEERRKMRTLEKETQMKNMMDTIVAQRLSKTNPSL